MESLLNRAAWITSRLVLISLVVVCGARAFAADSDEELEAKVKAAFIPKIASFVSWPAEALGDTNAPIVIGILGTDPFGPQFDEGLKGTFAHGHPLVVKRFSDPSMSGDVHILFVSAIAAQRFPEIHKVLAVKPVLTLGDVSGFAESGGMINFSKVAGKLRFEINLDATEAAGLQVSSRLLQVSKVIRGKGPQ